MTRALVLDIGNTRSKAAVFADGIPLSEIVLLSGNSSHLLLELIDKYKPAYSIWSAVGKENGEYVGILQQRTDTLQLSHNLIFPFVNNYATPHTLGMDRAAGVAGAMQLFPGRHCLVIDAGTCVTFDFVTREKQYLGGAISPGLNMRLKAMHTFTEKLPDLVFELPAGYIGNTTQNSMLSGAYFGLLGEINDTISRYEEQFGDVQVVLCGGDAGLFDKQTKKSIFAAPELVLHGLYKILQLNAR